jgi:NAD(P)-dependent dehydrogenase (short-subunit alcohol dehydrogenase family)
VLAQCLSKLGRVDAPFNAAGLSGRRFGDGPAHECTGEGWERKKQPLTGGMVDAGDVARAAVFLPGAGARSITGVVFTVAGGWSATGA